MKFLVLFAAAFCLSSAIAQDAKVKARIDKMDFWRACSELGKVVRTPLKSRSESAIQSMIYISEKYQVGGDEWGVIEKRLARVGMSSCGAAASWGKPEHVNSTTTSRGTRSQWVYGGRNYLYIDSSGRVSTIQN